MGLKSKFQSDSEEPKPHSKGFILVFTIILILGVTAISVGTIYNGKMGRMSANNYKHRLKTFSASDGLMTLLAQEMINGKASKYIVGTRMGEIQGKVWFGIGTTDMDDFKLKILAKPTPDSVMTSKYLGTILDKNNFGIKWTGWIVPPTSGIYTFFVRSDEECDFHLSTDEKSANLSTSPISFLESDVDKWPESGTGVSKPFPLVAGKRYYFEFYHADNVGLGLGMVGWNGPNFFNERPISGSYISKFSQDLVATANIMVGSLPVRYQISPAGQDQYQIFTEALEIKSDGSADTLFRAPLHQSLSMLGEKEAPPEKLKIPVIHYDFLANKSNPDFNEWDGISAGVRPGMVKPKLTNFIPKDAAYFGRTTIPKPSFNKNDKTRSCGINMWFRDWIPVNNVYAYGKTSIGCGTTIFDPVGEAYKNTKYYDSLLFELDPSEGPETYVYSRTGFSEPGYFPLDSITGVFKADPPGATHNYAFTTELHTTFKHRSGLIFNFWGDDDVFVFINDTLVIDLGGIHAPEEAYLNLDDLKFLTYGQTYTFDLYQCERMQYNSASRMVTNICLPPPKGNPVTSWTRDYGGVD